jgi:hypothetical protein
MFAEGEYGYGENDIISWKSEPDDNTNIRIRWRANASYFYIAKAFVRDEIDGGI